MFTVGLTGGIASGKSFVIEYLKTLKIPTHESDKVVGFLYKKPTQKFIRYLYKEGFGKAIIKKEINKKIIREEMLFNKNKRKKLEKFIHDEVKIKREIFIKKNKKNKIIFLDIPLLFESKLESEFDFVCSTIAPLKTREKRALQRPGMDRLTFKLIVENQAKDGVRRIGSDYIINTSKTNHQTYLQVDNIIYDIINNKQ